jgi:hypothetical protein
MPKQREQSTTRKSLSPFIATVSTTTCHQAVHHHPPQDELLWKELEFRKRELFNLLDY